MDTDLVERKEVNGSVVFKLHDNTIVRQEDMLEICNLGCKSPIQLHRENLGLTQAAQDYGSQYFTQLLQNGVMSINEVRASEELNPIDGGDHSHVQVNQIRLDPMQAYSDQISSDGNGQPHT